MKKTIIITASLIPATAFAHGSDAAFLIIWSYIVLVPLALLFAMFGSYSLKRKLYAVGGFILFSVIAMSTLGLVPETHKPWIDTPIAVALVVIPVIGFALGFRLGRAR